MLNLIKLTYMKRLSFLFLLFFVFSLTWGQNKSPQDTTKKKTQPTVTQGQQAKGGNEEKQNSSGEEGKEGGQGNKDKTEPGGGQNTQGNKDSQEVHVTPNSSGVKRSISYRFSSAANDADPGEATFRCNNREAQDVTWVYVDDIDLRNEDQTNWYETWDKQTGATGRGQITIADTEGNIKAVFNVTNVFVDANGYWNIPVEYVSGSLPSDGSTYVYIFDRIAHTDVPPRNKPQPEPVTPPVVQPQPEPVTPPIVQPQPEPVTPPVVQPQPEPVTPPVVQPQPEPVTPPVVQPQPEPVTPPVVQPQPEPVTPPVVQPQPEPVTPPVVQPQPEPVAENKPATRPLPPTDRPGMKKPVAETPAPKPAEEFDAKPVTQNKPVIQPEPVIPVVVQPQPETVTPPVVQKEPEPVTPPVTQPQPQPQQPQQPQETRVPQTTQNKPVITQNTPAPTGSQGNTQPAPPQNKPVTPTTQTKQETPATQGNQTTAVNQQNQNNTNSPWTVYSQQTQPQKPVQQPQTTQRQETTATPQNTQPASQNKPVSATTTVPQPSQTIPANQQPQNAPGNTAPQYFSETYTGNAATSFSGGGGWYRGIIELGYGLGVSEYGMNNFRFNFINSIRISPKTYIGLGIGVRRFYENNSVWYPVSSKTNVPVFVDIHHTFRAKRCTPYFAIGFGGSASVDSGTSKTEGIFFSPSAGLWLWLSKRTAIFGGIAYEIEGLEYANYSDNLPFKSNSNSVSLNIGLAF